MSQYDVFLSYSSTDRAAAESLANQLQEQGLRVFLDQRELIPGTHWQDALQEALTNSQTCAVLMGAKPGPWQNEEMRVALGQRVKKEPKRVIPVLLPGVDVDAMPEFLKQRTWVDLRAGLDDENAIERLLAGIRDPAPAPQSPSKAAENPPQPDLPHSGTGAETQVPLWHRFRLEHTGLLFLVLGILLSILITVLPSDSNPPAQETSAEEEARSEAPTSEPDLYALRVQVLDPSGNPVDDSSLRVSSGNEPQLLPGGWWELEIPRAKLPLDGQITLWAEHPRWQTARQELNLGNDPNPTAEIRLEVPRERIGGAVVDAQGRQIEGARVSVLDHEGSSATTDSNGRFTLWVTAAREQTARLAVQHDDYAPPQGGSCFVGRDGCALILEAAQ